jgi:succinylarginine dihydrolase
VNAREINFDAIVGPTHNYAGLAYGNVASQKNKQSLSNPRQAALEGLAKMKFLADLGVPQGVLPPPLRPDLRLLRSVGYGGSDVDVLNAVYKEDPALLAAASSASAMWAANAATVSPSTDSADGRVHLSPANLISQLHRSIEATNTASVLRAIFQNPAVFTHHPPLPSQARWADEGAANHMRLCRQGGGAGVQIFVYGLQVAPPNDTGPKLFPARQTGEASRALARRHRLSVERTVFIQQNPAAIDAGVFHNDVAAVANENVLFCHSQAFADQAKVLDEIRSKFAALSSELLHVIEVSADELTLQESVETYLFNSQIVTLPDGTMSVIAPAECETHVRARAVIDRLLAAATPIRSVHFLSVRQSMRNGGGPACLRLRVVLNETERVAAHQGVFLDDTLYDLLVAWVNKHYREELAPGDLADPKLLEECRQALDELGRILRLSKSSS